MGGGRRRKNGRSKTAHATKVDDVPDEVLGLVFVRLTSPRDLVRAAFTCKRWRQAIAADGFRVLCYLHGAPSSHIAGHYRVDERLHAPRPPGSNPVFVPSPSWAGIVAARNLAIDFLPRTEYGSFTWVLADARGGLLLLLDPSLQPRLVVCDPLARRYRVIPPSGWFHGCEFMGAFLLDGEHAGARISLSNFKVTCALYHVLQGTARACAFSSAGGGRWTSGSTAVFGDEYWNATGAHVRFAGCGDDGSVAYWTNERVGIILALDKEAAELSVLQDNEQYAALRDKRHAPEYVYELPWPPTIRACLS